MQPRDRLSPILPQEDDDASCIPSQCSYIDWVDEQQLETDDGTHQDVPNQNADALAEDPLPTHPIDRELFAGMGDEELPSSQSPRQVLSGDAAEIRDSGPPCTPITQQDVSVVQDIEESPEKSRSTRSQAAKGLKLTAQTLAQAQAADPDGPEPSDGEDEDASQGEGSSIAKKTDAPDDFWVPMGLDVLTRQFKRAKQNYRKVCIEQSWAKL